MALGGHNHPSGAGRKQHLLTLLGMYRLDHGWTMAEATKERETLRRKTVAQIHEHFKNVTE